MVIGPDTPQGEYDIVYRVDTSGMRRRPPYFRETTFKLTVGEPAEGTGEGLTADSVLRLRRDNQQYRVRPGDDNNYFELYLDDKLVRVVEEED